MKLSISLNTVEKVKNFVGIISKEPDDFDILSGGRYVIDAKSIMGLFSLDLSKPLTLVSQTADAEHVKAILKDFIV